MRRGVTNDSALFAGGYAGKCNYCGNQGHKKENCEQMARDILSRRKSSKKNKRKKNANQAQVTCEHCDKRGHTEQQCWVKHPHLRNQAQNNNQTRRTRTNAAEQAKTAADAPSETVKQDEIILTTSDMANRCLESDPSIFIGDTGASGHMIGSDEFLIDWKEIHEPIEVANDGRMIATKIGKLPVTYVGQEGKYDFVLDQVRYVPQLGRFNLISLTRAMTNGFSLQNDKDTIVIKKGKLEIKFNIKVKTKTGHIMATRLLPRRTPQSTGRDLALKTIDINRFHEQTGHMGEAITRRLAEAHGITLVGKLEPCEPCALAKSRRKNLGHGGISVTKNPGEKLWVDISSIRTASYGGNKFWVLVVDDRTDYCWSFFVKRKSDIGDSLLNLFMDLKAKGIGVQTVRCDNAQENIAAKKLLTEKGFDVVFEYTAPHTPQQNGKVERKFATLYNRVRATLNSSGLIGEIRDKLWAECANHCTNLENIAATERKGIDIPWVDSKKNKRVLSNLHAFGELAVVKTAESIQSKAANKGMTVIYVGNSLNHHDDVYRFLNLKTRRIITSRDVVWLNLKLKENKLSENKQVDGDEADDNEEINIELIPDNQPSSRLFENYNLQDKAYDYDDDENEDAYNNQTESDDDGQSDTDDDEDKDDFIASKKTIRRPRALGGIRDYWNTEATKIYDQFAERRDRQIRERMKKADEEENDKGRELFSELAFFVKAGLMSDEVEFEEIPDEVDSPKENQHILDRLNYLKEKGDDANEIKKVVNELKANKPETYNDAFNHPDKRHRDQWRNAINKELSSMTEHNVWTVIKRNTMPEGRRCVKSKWIFDVKRDGRYKARLVACGYSQIPGVDFVESYAPVINDITWRILLIAKLMRNYSAKIVDVETAFLHGELDEEIYMEPPPGVNAKDDECLRLNKAIYGLVQAARQYYKKFTNELKKRGYEGGDVDPCLLMKNIDGNPIYMSIYVDNTLIVGKEEAINKTIKDMEDSGFKLKIEGNMDDYLSCEISPDKSGHGVYIHQPHLLKKMENKFKNYLVQQRIKPKTPGTPLKHLLSKEEITLDKDKHKKYQSGASMLLYLTKHSRPDISNAVRELSKALENPGPKAWKEMLRVMTYVMDTKNYALVMKPRGKLEEWILLAFSDSDWAADRETRKSITGYVLFLCGVPICWKSKGQYSPALSSTEAEYVALAEVTKEIKFIYQILISMGIRVPLPIIVRIDNNGAIFMSNNLAISERTKHIDIKYNFVRQYVEEGFIKVIFVRSEDNTADIFTKNLSSELHQKHKKELVMEKEYRKL